MSSKEYKIWLAKPEHTTFYVVRWEDPESGKTHQKSTRQTKKKDADRFLGQFRAELLKKGCLGPRNSSWSNFRERYDAEYLSGLQGTTRNKVYGIFNAVEKHLQPTKLTDLTASRLSKFVAQLRESGLEESTIDGYLGHLGAALNWAVDNDLLATVPKLPKIKRRKVYKKPKGRAPTEEEFRKILAAVPQVVGKDRAPSWQRFLQGLWWSGLRLGEALDLWWDRDDRLHIDLSGKRPVFVILAECEKGHEDRLLPMAPEFAKFLLDLPESERKGRVFQPEADRVHGESLTLDRVSRIISDIGEKAGVVVHTAPKSGKVKYASAHDFRRAFGDRWACLVTSAVLMSLMRHKSIDTTMKYYVGRSVQATAELVWDAYSRKVADLPPTDQRDTSRDTPRETDGEKLP